MAQIFTGAKAKVKINNITVGFVGGLNINQENTLSDVDVIGQLDVGDLAETGHKVNFSINYFKALDAAQSDKTSAEGGGATNAAVLLGIDNPNLPAMRDQTYFDVIVMDNNNNEIYKLERCKFEGGSGQVDARGLWQGTWNFRAIRGFGL